MLFWESKTQHSNPSFAHWPQTVHEKAQVPKYRKPANPPHEPTEQFHAEMRYAGTHPTLCKNIMAIIMTCHIRLLYYTMSKLWRDQSNTPAPKLVVQRKAKYRDPALTIQNYKLHFGHIYAYASCTEYSSTCTSISFSNADSFHRMPA